MVRNFDLNVDRVLEDWEVAHALREVIANALDERNLTNSTDVIISADSSGHWHVRDFGRGLRHEHLTQNENEEKLKHPNLVIGKFGVGLKDALATFERHGVKVLIHSPYGDIRLERMAKHDFEDVVTLHAAVSDPQNSHFVGTDVELDGATAADVTKAKEFFLQYSEEQVLETTNLGQVLQRCAGAKGRIYINGLRVAEEENFLFSYNVTSLTTAMRRALNRERTNIGRTAYTDRVKQILLACRSQTVADHLVRDLSGYESGTLHDEVHWVDVQTHASKLLNATEKVIFVTPEQLLDAREVADRAQRDGYRVITVPETVAGKIRGSVDASGAPIVDADTYVREWAASFRFEFVEPNQLTRAERAVFGLTNKILRLAGGKPQPVREVRISETMRPEVGTTHEALGLWDPTNGRIIIKRNQLRTLATYGGTLLHELTHARGGHGDVSRDFETDLTETIGTLVAGTVKRWF